MSKFYNRMKGKADSLLTKYGHAINLIDGNRNVLATYQGLKSTVKTDNTLGALIEGADTSVYITAGTFEPDTTHYLDMDGSIWKIIFVDKVRPTDTTIMYTLYVSQGG